MTQSNKIECLDAAVVRHCLGAALDRVRTEGARVAIEDRGEPVAALVPWAEFERWARLDAEWESRATVIDRIRAGNEHFDPEEIERDVAEEIAAMRAERRVPTSPHSAA